MILQTIQFVSRERINTFVNVLVIGFNTGAIALDIYANNWRGAALQSLALLFVMTAWTLTDYMKRNMHAQFAVYREQLDMAKTMHAKMKEADVVVHDMDIDSRVKH